MKKVLIVMAALAGAAAGILVWRRRGSTAAVADVSAQWARSVSGAVEVAASSVARAAYRATAQVNDLAQATKGMVTELAQTAAEAAQEAAQEAAEESVKETPPQAAPATSAKKTSAPQKSSTPRKPPASKPPAPDADATA